MLLQYTVPVKGTAALHAREARVLHAHYTQWPRTLHANNPNACNYTDDISRSRLDIACKLTRIRSTVFGFDFLLVTLVRFIS